MVQFIQINNTVVIENLSKINELTAVAQKQADTILWAYIIGFIVGLGLIVYAIIKVRQWYFKHYVWCLIHTSPTTFEDIRCRRKDKNFTYNKEEYVIDNKLIKNSELHYLPGLPNPLILSPGVISYDKVSTADIVAIKETTVIEKFRTAEDFMGMIKTYHIIEIIGILLIGFGIWLIYSHISDALKGIDFANAQLQWIINNTHR